MASNTYRMYMAVEESRTQGRSELVGEVFFSKPQFSMPTITKGVQKAAVWNQHIYKQNRIYFRGKTQRGNYITTNKRMLSGILPVINAVWFSPHSTCLTLPLLKCSTTLGKRDSNMNVPWPSCPNWPRPNEYTLCSALPDMCNI